MLVQLKPRSASEHNVNKNFHGSTEEHTTRTAGEDTLTTIKTFADTTHGWWTAWAEDGDEVLVDVIEEIQKGVWISNGGNFHGNIENSTNLKLIEHFPNITKTGDVVSDQERRNHYGELVESYMVCDSVEQALEYWRGAIINPDHKFVISLMPVEKKHESEGGWRWHKWGAYIGTQKPQCEYLLDEPEIELVYCAHIYNVEEISNDSPI